MAGECIFRAPEGTILNFFFTWQQKIFIFKELQKAAEDAELQQIGELTKMLKKQKKH